MKTIKQIADEIGTTKQALQKRMSRDPLHTNLIPHISIKGTTKYIDANGETLIKIAFGSIDKPIAIDIDEGMDSLKMGIDKPMDTNINSIDVFMDAGIDTMDKPVGMGIGRYKTGIDSMSESLIDLLKLEIEAKNRQISDLQNTIDTQVSIIDAQTEIIATQAANIKDLTTSLNAAQALHAGTIQKQLTNIATGEAAPANERLERRRPWWKFWST